MDELRAGIVLRLLRASVVAGMAGSFGVIAHVAAGGRLPSTTTLGVGVVLLFAGTAALLGGPASRSRLVALVAGGQLATHTLMTLTAPHAASPTTGGGSHPVPSGAGGAGHPVVPTTGPHWTGHLVDDFTGPHALMAIAHACAAAGLALWLAIGEQALWVLLCAAAVVAVLVAAALTVVPSCTPVRRMLVVARLHARSLRPSAPPPLAGSWALRGPPVGAARAASS